MICQKLSISVFFCSPLARQEITSPHLYAIAFAFMQSESNLRLKFLSVRGHRATSPAARELSIEGSRCDTDLGCNDPSEPFLGETLPFSTSHAVSRCATVRSVSTSV